MHITDIACHTVAVPFREEEIWAFGRRSYLEAVILEIATDEGLTGVGEAAGYPSVEIVNAVIESLKPLVVGEDPFDIERILKRMYILGTWHHVKGSSPGISGIEMACWDIVGKVCGQPIVNLLGGRVRDDVEYFYYLSQKPPENMAEDARTGRALGFRTFYVKVGSEDARLDIARVEAVREGAGPEAQIRVDANEAWSTAAAVRVLREMERFGLELAEQPVSGSNLEEMAYLRSRIDTPLLANESSWTRWDQLEVIKHSAADVISVDNQMDGGLLNMKRSAGMCETAGLPVLKHSLGELGIAMYAGAHLVATCPNFLYANQSYASFLADDVIQGVNALEYQNGRLAVPTGAGIGVEIDKEKLERYKEKYEQNRQERVRSEDSFVPIWPKL
jgi:L-alanine-DL-glutamate epimerase-like enolase superfamily enzyme